MLTKFRWVWPQIQTNPELEVPTETQDEERIWIFSRWIGIADSRRVLEKLTFYILDTYDYDPRRQNNPRFYRVLAPWWLNRIITRHENEFSFTEEIRDSQGRVYLCQYRTQYSVTLRNCLSL